MSATHVRRLATLLALVPGCFYVDPINQRPSLDIRVESGGEVYRGSRVALQAVANDPEGQTVAFQWRVYLCTDATVPTTGCDPAPYYTEIRDQARFTVPNLRADRVTPVLGVLIYLEGKDDLGATARPVQQLAIAVANKPPELALRLASSYGLVIDTPVDLFAKVGDPDDLLTAVAQLDWTVFSPASQPAYELTDLTVPQDPQDPTHLQLGKRLVPHGLGMWDIAVAAHDPTGAVTTEHVAFTVVADHAPCLAQWSPITAPAGQTLPFLAPTLFQIPVVADDLDGYPSTPDAIRGTTTFTWSLQTNGGARQPLAGVATNHVALDPAAFVPGDLVELRVEIADRKQTAITCADASATCSVISDASCLQRLTWHLEVR